MSVPEVKAGSFAGWSYMISMTERQIEMAKDHLESLEKELLFYRNQLEKEKAA